LLERALEQDYDAGFPARGRAQQQQQPAADFRAGGRSLEIIRQSFQRRVDSEQFVGEQVVARAFIGTDLAALPAQHVPHVLVAVAGNAPWIAGNDFLEELAKGSGPLRCTMLLRKGNEVLKKRALPLSLASYHRTPSFCSEQIASVGTDTVKGAWFR